MFNKDILLIDAEFSGLDPAKNEITQIAGVLLDRKTLKEKKHFNSFIKPTKWKNRDPESVAVSGISYDQIKTAPSVSTVIRKFDKTFGHDVILAYYGGVLDITFLSATYNKAGMKFPFDHHFFNIWGVMYAYLAKSGGLTSKKNFGGFSLETMMKLFKIESPPLHDALVDCRVEAEILRHVMKNLKA